MESDENTKTEDHPTGILLGGTVLRINGEIISDGGGFYVNGTGVELPKPTDEKE
jgi:hypothetical protein